MTGRHHPRRTVRGAFAGTIIALAGMTAACGGGSEPTGEGGTADALRLGYFANVTHATPVVGVADGSYQKALGDTKLETQIFNAGPAAVEAVLGGSLDATYIGPNPAINAFIKTKGEGIRIVSGSTSGGAQLVVQPDITSPEQLKGKTLASPQLGGTQDVALRAWLLDQGFETTLDGAGDVNISPTDNATTLQLFQQGKIAGAWVPEPWASRLVLDGGGKVLVDEKDLWPDGEFVTTHLMVTTDYLEKFPKTVKALLSAQLDTEDWIAAHPDDAKATINAQLEEITGKKLGPEVLDRAFANITLTHDPLAETLKTSAQAAVDAGFPEATTKLEGIYDLTLLRELLTERKLDGVDDAGWQAKS